jgi:hypothetical protein
MDKATSFFDCAFSRTQIVQCPCSRYQNSRCLEDMRTIGIHLCKNSFVLGYEVWTFHDESGTRVVAEDEHDCDVRDVDRIDEMLEAIQEMLLRILLQRRLRRSSNFPKLQKSHFMNTQK